MQSGEAEGAAFEGLGSHASFSDLPDSIAVKILGLLSQSERAEAALVCKAWSRLANSPELIHTVECDCRDSNGIATLESLLAWLCRHGVRHVRSLTLWAALVNVRPVDQDAAHVAARERLVCGCMAALAACGGLQRLKLQLGTLDVGLSSWLGAMHGLQQLALDASKTISLGNWTSGLHSLQQLTLEAPSLQLPPALPPTLTRVAIIDYWQEELPPQVLELPALQELELRSCTVLAPDSWQGLLGVAPTLERLVVWPLAYVPGEVTALTRLTVLEFEGLDYDETLHEQLAAALHHLQRLEVLLLAGVDLTDPVASALAALPALRGLWHRPDDGHPAGMPLGTWSSSLQLLAAPAPILANSLPLLRAASRLEQLHIHYDAYDPPDEWQPLFQWAALHPTLQQLCFETDDEDAPMSRDLSNAMLRLQRQKPQLLVHLTPFRSSQEALARL